MDELFYVLSFAWFGAWLLAVADVILAAISRE